MKSQKNLICQPKEKKKKTKQSKKKKKKKKKWIGKKEGGRSEWKDSNRTERFYCLLIETFEQLEQLEPRWKKRMNQCYFKKI